MLAAAATALSTPSPTGPTLAADLSSPGSGPGTTATDPNAARALPPAEIRLAPGAAGLSELRMTDRGPTLDIGISGWAAASAAERRELARVLRVRLGRRGLRPGAIRVKP